MKTMVIAEAGSCWILTKHKDRNFQFALKMIKVAAQAGADAVKFQWVSDPAQMARRRNIAQGTYDYLSWPIQWHAVFAEESHRLGIKYGCSVYLPQDIEALLPMVDYFKVASLEFQAMDLIEALKKTGKNFFISNGVTNSKITGQDFRDAWAPNGYVLHCTSGYPTPIDQAHLEAIKMVDGFSDHTANVLTGAVAVASGAKFIEVHFRLNETRQHCPDYPHSLPPPALATYIKNIRVTDRMMGWSYLKQIQPAEMDLVRHRVIHG